MPLQQRSQQTRQKLLEASVRILAEQGYPALSFVEVAKVAGVSRGAIHHHFNNKIELVQEVIAHIGESILGNVLPNIDQSNPGQHPLAIMIDLVWDQLNRQEFIAFQQVRSIAQGDAALREKVGPQLRDVLAQWLNEADNLRIEHSQANSQLPRIILAALSGAAIADQALGPSSSDPNREHFRAQLLSMVVAAEERI